MTCVVADIQMAGSLDPRDGWTADGCPIARTFDTVGTRSAFLILREAFYGATRFEQFVQRSGLSEPVVAERLRDLTAEELLERVPYRETGKRTRNEYRLTDKGRELLPVLVAMMRWGDRWLVPGGARVELTHAGCGSQVGVALRCEKGHDVETGELQLRDRRELA